MTKWLWRTIASRMSSTRSGVLANFSESKCSKAGRFVAGAETVVMTVAEVMGAIASCTIAPLRMKRKTLQSPEKTRWSPASCRGASPPPGT